MREILEKGTGEDLSQYTNEDILELYTGLAGDLGVDSMSIDDAHASITKETGAPVEAQAEGGSATKEDFKPIDDADVGTKESVEDEFVSSEPDPDRDMPSQEELDDMVEAEEVVEQAPEPQAAAAGGGGGPPDDPERLQRLLDASKLSEKKKKADPDLGPYMRGKGANRTSKAAAEIEEFLSQNGYTITQSGKISEAKAPKASKPKNKKEPTGDAVDTSADERIDGGDELNGTADADMGDETPGYKAIDDDLPDPPPEKPETKKDTGKNKKDTGGNETKSSSGKTQRWWEQTIPAKEVTGRSDRIWIQSNDPGPNAPQDAKAKFLNDLDARLNSRDAEVTAKADAQTEELKAARDAETAANDEKRKKFKKKVGYGALGTAELIRELVSNARRNPDEEGGFVTPNMTEPIMAAANLLTGGGVEGINSTQAPQQQQGRDPNDVIDSAIGRSASPFSRVLEDFGPPQNAPGRLPADEPVSTEDIIRRNRPQ
jgi:hypothetical protein